MVSSFWTEDIIDAVRWEELITSSLPQLTVFKFQFSYRFRSSEKDTILGKFEKFQSDFWREQHRWCVEYSSDSNPPTIYTLPYMLNTADYNYLPKKSKPFDNITHLNVYLLEMRTKFQHHLKNVTKLTLCMNFSRKQNSNVSLRIEHFQYLKRIVNLSNIKHLTLSDEYMLLLIHILYYTERDFLIKNFCGYSILPDENFKLDRNRYCDSYFFKLTLMIIDFSIYVRRNNQCFTNLFLSLSKEIDHTYLIYED
jgi:hypothetical protein